jgi:hypothetical protein
MIQLKLETTGLLIFGSCSPRVLQQGITKFGERATKEDVNKFLINVRNTFGNLHSELF